MEATWPREVDKFSSAFVSIAHGFNQATYCCVSFSVYNRKSFLGQPLKKMVLAIKDGTGEP